MNGQRRLTTVAFRRKSVFFSISATLLLLLPLPAAAKTLDQELTYKGQDDVIESPVANDNGATMETVDDAGDALGFSGDARGRHRASDLLRLLSKASEREFHGGAGGRSGEKRKWSNRESLRVWGKREAMKHQSFQREEDGPLFGSTADGGDHVVDGKDDGLLLTYKKQSGRTRHDGRDSTPYNSLEERFRLGEFSYPVENISSLDGDETQSMDIINGLNAATKFRGQSRKRKWERNSLRIWGKRTSEPDFADEIIDSSAYPNMRRRKWENLPLRVWGK